MLWCKERCKFSKRSWECKILLQSYHLPFTEKDFPHTSQEKGFSPLWIIMWIFKLPKCPNALLHISQQCRFSWSLKMWSFKVFLTLNALSHRLHENGVGLLWVLMWFFKSDFRLYDLLHSLQWKRPSWSAAMGRKSCKKY